MIRPININLNAAHPELPLVEATTFTGAPSSVFIRGVPKAVGNWSITAVSVAVTYPDNTTTARAAVESAEGVWVATIPGTATSGRTAAGFKIMADGIDENGDAVTGYVLGFADFAVLSFFPVPAPGETFFYLRYFDTAPTPPKEGDAAKIDGVLKFYNGNTWEAFAAPVTLDDAVTRTSANGVKSSGIWSAIWGALAALPTGFTSLYDWVVSRLFEYRHKLDLNVYSRGNASVTFPDGFSITYMDDTYVATLGGETIEFYGPITSTAVPQYNFWVPYYYKDMTDFDPQAQSVWCLFGDIGNSTPNSLMFRTGASYSIANWNTESPTLTLSNGEATGDAPTMARPLGATGDTLAKVSQMNTALAGKANDNAVVKLTGDQDIYGIKTFNGAMVTAGINARGSVSANGITIKTDYNLNFLGSGNILMDGGSILVRGGFAVFSRTDGTQSPQFIIQELDDEGASIGQYSILLPFASGTLALTSAIPYNLVTKTITNGAVSLDDRAINAVAVSSSLASLTVNFPTATSGKVRDFGLRLTVASGITTAPELALPQGVTCENADGEAPEIGADGAATILYFTETASGVFLVKGEVVTAIS